MAAFFLFLLVFLVAVAVVTFGAMTFFRMFASIGMLLTALRGLQFEEIAAAAASDAGDQDDDNGKKFLHVSCLFGYLKN
jgi:hypothetical protein